MLKRHRTFLVLLMIGLFIVTIAAQNNPVIQEARKAARLFWQRADVERLRGKYEEAKAAYEKAAEKWTEARNRRFAAVTGLMVELCETMPVNVKKLRDGIYAGSAQGYSGNVAVEVKVQRGRIRGFRFTDQKESRPLKSLEVVPTNIIRRQSPSVDAVTGATITSYAVMSATARALKKAAPPETKP